MCMTTVRTVRPSQTGLGMYVRRMSKNFTCVISCRVGLVRTSYAGEKPDPSPEQVCGAGMLHLCERQVLCRIHIV